MKAPGGACHLDVALQPLAEVLEHGRAALCWHVITLTYGVTGWQHVGK